MTSGPINSIISPPRTSNCWHFNILYLELNFYYFAVHVFLFAAHARFVLLALTIATVDVGNVNFSLLPSRLHVTEIGQTIHRRENFVRDWPIFFFFSLSQSVARRINAKRNLMNMSRLNSNHFLSTNRCAKEAKMPERIRRHWWIFNVTK